MGKLIINLSILLMTTIVYSCASMKKNITEQPEKIQPIHDELYNTISSLDSALFNAFNTCNVEVFTKFLTDDIEFYHDESGLMISAKTQSDGLKTRCAEQEKNGALRRELVKGSLEVYPLPNYGALEIGEHNFYRTLPGQNEKLTTVAKFVNIWQKRNGEWKVSRIVSYAHRSAK